MPNSKYQVTCRDCGWSGLADAIRCGRSKLGYCPKCAAVLGLPAAVTLPAIERSTGVMAGTFRANATSVRILYRLDGIITQSDPLVLVRDTHGRVIVRHPVYGTYMGSSICEALAALLEHSHAAR